MAAIHLINLEYLVLDIAIGIIGFIGCNVMMIRIGRSLGRIMDGYWASIYLMNSLSGFIAGYTIKLDNTTAKQLELLSLFILVSSVSSYYYIYIRYREASNSFLLSYFQLSDYIRTRTSRSIVNLQQVPAMYGNIKEQFLNEFSGELKNNPTLQKLCELIDLADNEIRKQPDVAKS